MLSVASVFISLFGETQPQSVFLLPLADAVWRDSLSRQRVGSSSQACIH